MTSQGGPSKKSSCPACGGYIVCFCLLSFRFNFMFINFLTMQLLSSPFSCPFISEFQYLAVASLQLLSFPLMSFHFLSFKLKDFRDPKKHNFFLKPFIEKVLVFESIGIEMQSSNRIEATRMHKKSNQDLIPKSPHKEITAGGGRLDPTRLNQTDQDSLKKAKARRSSFRQPENMKKKPIHHESYTLHEDPLHNQLRS